MHWDSNRHRWRLPTLLMLLLVSASGGAVEPAEDPAAQVTQAPSAEAQIEALKLRMLGMEGKLKESAHARKSAEQARMEAERRLAESMREMERVTAEVARLKESQLALEQALSERDRKLAELDGERISQKTAYEALDRRLAALRARVPVQDGGSLTPEQAREGARLAFEELRQVLQDQGASGDTHDLAALQSAEQKLHRRQMTLARTAEVKGVYRIRPNDTLVLISSRCYGDSSRWQSLFEANRHVLDDPDQLIPGVTLIIP
jgi:nucleoid-associated protein YgaU